MRLRGRFVPVSLVALVAGASMALAQDAQQVYTIKDDVQVPQLVREVKPVYTEAAKKEGIQGSVGLDAIVLTDGTVGEVRVTQSLDAKYGLDEQAVKALKQWQFTPGKKDGKPVPVRVDVEMTFTLK
jgi:TonB family protein